MKTNQKRKVIVSLFKQKQKYNIDDQFVHYYYFVKDSNDYHWFEQQLKVIS